ncbi:Oidioi.mRNA.OKI2018_I69.XSR.g14699.t1.cds [Oikopleura dioica]|uniref:Oidioi.mRNA.OKI2018_I69.XSR.g14699.t1.cds n=1 Tax=Oikopleura dioica TaxID=34765 RepID=A0ABN7SEL6_OIKDI|nr:Oidioi.mRNA.OKI2018_I69.XSR.g14699.t1.cds [Oikopleura dioica]
MKVGYSICLLSSIAGADSRIRLEKGYYGRLFVKTVRPDGKTTWATVCSNEKSPITKKFANTVCLNINSELESFSWKNTTDPRTKGYPLIQEKSLFCDDETDFSTCFGNFKSSDCRDHQNDVVINCKKPLSFDKSVQWAEWSEWDSDRFFFKWRSRNCSSELRTFNEDIVSCALKFPDSGNWFHGEICKEETCFKADLLDYSTVFDDSSTDYIPDNYIFDDEDFTSESSGEAGFTRRGKQSSAAFLTLTPSLLLFLFLNTILA